MLDVLGLPTLFDADSRYDEGTEVRFDLEPSMPDKDLAAAPPGLEKKTGHIEDYISGLQVKATPEEVEAVQVFSMRLVEDYGYEKSQIQTRPQFRVRKLTVGLRIPRRGVEQLLATALGIEISVGSTRS